MSRVRARLVNIGIRETNVAVQVKFDYLREGGAALPGAWSRQITREIPRTAAVNTMLVRVEQLVRPREERAWADLPVVKDIALLHIDVRRYKDADYGLAVSYERLDASGAPIEGFGGYTLFRYIVGAYDWAGGDTNEGLETDLPPVAQGILDWVETHIEEHVIKGKQNG